MANENVCTHERSKIKMNVEFLKGIHLFPFHFIIINIIVITTEPFFLLLAQQHATP
jgi:hypothetical protein